MSKQHILYIQKHPYAEGSKERLNEKYETTHVKTGEEAKQSVNSEGENFYAILADPDVDDMSREELFKILRSGKRGKESRLILAVACGFNRLKKKDIAEFNVEEAFVWNAHATTYFLAEEGKKEHSVLHTAI